MKTNQSNFGHIEIDIHGMTKYQAKVFIDSQLKKANKSTYRIVVIHGHNLGRELMNMVRREYKNHPKVVRIEIGMNMGTTELVLRELF